MNKKIAFTLKYRYIQTLNVDKTEKNTHLNISIFRSKKIAHKITDFNYNQKILIFPSKAIDSSRAFCS